MDALRRLALTVAGLLCVGFALQPAVAQEGRMPGYFPTGEEVKLLGGESRELYGRHIGGLNNPGPDEGSLTASGLWHQDEEPTDSFYERHDNIFSPLDSALGVLAPGEVFHVEGDEINSSRFYGYADPGFPLTRDFNPDLATMKLGPLYLDLISLSGTVLYSDYQGTGNAGDDDGWLSAISLAFRGVAQITDNLYLSLTGEVYYLPGDNEVGFFFGNGGHSMLRIAYEDRIGDWNYVIFDEFSARHRLSEIFDEVEHDEIEVAGRYRFGRYDNLRSSDYFDGDSIFFVNRLGAAISGPVNDIIQGSASFEHFDYWKTLDFDHQRDWDQLTARLEYSGYEWLISPFFEYRLVALDDWSVLNHTVWLGGRSRLTENLRAEAKVGFFKATGNEREVDRPIAEIGLIHHLGENTTHSLYAGARQYLWEEADNWMATYARYALTHRLSSRLRANAHIQYSELDNLDGVTYDRRGWSGGANLTAHLSDYTVAQAGVYLDDWDQKSPVNADRSRAIYRASIKQRLLPYVHARLLYQYEDSHTRGSSGYNEHLYMLTVTHLF